MTETLLRYVLTVLPVLSPVAIILLILLFMPDTIEKWSALLWKWLDKSGRTAGGIFRFASKKYIKHDLQGRVNGFVRRLRRRVPSIDAEKLRIEWVDPNIERATFIANGHVVIRLRRDDPQDHNFVHGAYMFVASTLLRKPKRYLSPSQREALDLFVCTKLIEEEKSAIVGFFLDEYLHPGTDDTKTKVALYVDDFAVIDRATLFFNIFLHELEYLGDKVFGRRRDDLVVSEVDDLIGFLKPIADRTVGDTGDLHFKGSYCSVGVVIVGKPAKLLSSIEPYITYMQKHLVESNVETMYLLSRAENHDKIEEIAERFVGHYECVRRRKYEGPIKYADGAKMLPQYLVVLRKRGIKVIQPSD